MQRDALWCADLGDGRYQNPVLFCDYSDPDAVYVDGVYYMTASTFNYVPGLPILTSTDLVNWELKNYALPAIPVARYALPCHAQGVWAPAIRYHDGFFYIYFGMPDEGIFMVRAKDALGTWDAPVCVLAGKGLIDPCPYWDEDGNAYVVHGYAKSRIGFKSFLGLFPMHPDGTHAIGVDRILYDGRATQMTIEGPKVETRGGFVYIWAPAGGVATGWQTVLRAKTIHGPFEERIILRQGDSPTNGPHQGALLSTHDGEDWFIHFQSRGGYGRIVHLQPVHWTDDGWPVAGEVTDDPTCGQPVLVHKKPALPASLPRSLQASDDFSSTTLALQWQFMGNPREEFYSLTARPHHLRLHAIPMPMDTPLLLWHCPQVLSQKFVCPQFVAQVTMNFSHLAQDEQAGLALLGGEYAYLAVRREGEALLLCFVTSKAQGNTQTETLQWKSPLPHSTSLQLRMHVMPDAAQKNGITHFSFRLEGEDAWQTLDFSVTAAQHTWVGSRIALFSMPLAASTAIGYADFSNFILTKDEEV